jgi:hypothetical protein
MDEAKINHKEWMGTFPQMYRVPMTIDSLSDKQLNILNKYL